MEHVQERHFQETPKCKTNNFVRKYLGKRLHELVPHVRMFRRGHRSSLKVHWVIDLTRIHKDLIRSSVYIFYYRIFLIYLRIGKE